LLGEVFLQIARDLAGFAGDERQLRGWAFSLAHHRLVDDRRRRSRRPVEPTPVETLERRGPTGDVEAEALDRLGVERVRALLAALPEGQQTVLVLRILGGLTVEEVARVIGKRPGAVKALQRRGLAAVRRELIDAGVPL
jgi:RNA polymerase sigma-70 factor (ECF subfamily)